MNWRYVGEPSQTDGQGGISQAEAVHAALLPIGLRGTILYFAGSGLVRLPNWKVHPENHPEYAHTVNWEDVENFSPYWPHLENIIGNVDLQNAHDTTKPQIDHTRLFDCSNNLILNPGSPDADIFCSGHAFLPDGRLLVAGGTLEYPADTLGGGHGEHWSGSRKSFIYQAFSRGSSWLVGPLMNRNPETGYGGGRWYPTLITLHTGDIIAMCGHPSIPYIYTDDFREDDDYRHNNTKPEIFNIATMSWRVIDKALGVVGSDVFIPYYPRVHVVPHTGEIFIVQPMYSDDVKICEAFDIPAGCSSIDSDIHPNYEIDVQDKSLFYNFNTQEVTNAFPGPHLIEDIYLIPTSQHTSSVMLPLLHDENYHARILITGGRIPLIADLAPFDGSLPSWKPTAARTIQGNQVAVNVGGHKGTPGGDYVLIDVLPQRHYLNSTLLPTGDVVITGGVSGFSGFDKDGKPIYLDDVDGVREVEIYTPAQNGEPDSWITGPPANEVRGYHSTALLIPDGRIWTAGSQINDGPANLAIEFFEPDYFQNQDRIQIENSPETVTYGQTFTVSFIGTENNSPVKRVVFMRLGSVTHSFDGDQRYISVPFIQYGNKVECNAPPDSTIAPPGYYMLWLIDELNMPCKYAPFVLLSKFGFNQFAVQNAAIPGGIAAVSRVPGSIEVMWIGNDGSIQDANWYAGQGWNFGAIPYQVRASKGGIAVLSRIPESLELFWVGEDGSIQDAFWYSGPNPIWQTFTLADQGSASTRSTIAAASRIPNSMEIFWADDNGILWHSAWYDGNQWQKAPLLSQQTVKTGLSARISVVSRIPNSLELFWIGEDGSVNGTFWYEGQDGWTEYELRPAGSASLSGDISAVSRIADTIEVFWIGPDGSVQDANWYDGRGWHFSPLFSAFGETNIGSVKAVSRSAQTIDVCWTDITGVVRHANWEEGSEWQFDIVPKNSGYYAIPFSYNASPISVVARNGTNSIEFFYILQNSAIQDAYLYY